MVTIETVHEIRPRLTGEFEYTGFQPRTEAMEIAYRWGQELHSGQKRFSGEPYFETHCGYVAAFLDRMIGKEAWTIAGLLHDSVEDRGGTLEQIREMFPGALGEEVAYIVDGVTKLSAPRNGRSRELETLRKIAMFRDPAVFLVKLADKSHNVLTLQHMPLPKRRQKAQEAIRAYGKLAGILNCYRWRRWLEDMAFPHAEPEIYRFVKEQVDHDPRLQLGFINPMMQKLGRVMEDAGIGGRVEIIVNGYWQAWQKLRRAARMRKASLSSFANVNDLISFRLIVDSNREEDCYLLLAAVNRFWGSHLDQDRFDDYIAYPQNGYRALQVTGWVPNAGAVEVAITTDDMEGENLWGVIYAIQHNKDISEYRPVEILTPTGGTRFLTEGSTVLDAVASIQQEFLLDKISAVEVNGVMANLGDIVSPGDVVEVITNGPRLQPREDWLQYCNESTARLLRVVLATEALRLAGEKGREWIKEVLVQRGILALEDVFSLERDKFDNLLERLGCSSLQDLYSAVGGGAIPLVDISAALDEVGISKDVLGWTSIHIIGSEAGNRPGVLARLAGLVSDAGGNIIRTVNDTRPDGSFTLRLVLRNVEPERKESLRQAYLTSGVDFEVMEIV